MWDVPMLGSHPHDPCATKDGAIWWIGQLSNKPDRLDPTTGKVTEWQSPSGPKSGPYGIVFTKGALWYSVSFANPNTVVRFDPKTEKFQTWEISGGGDIVRNMDVAPNRNLMTANSPVNHVGMVEIK